MGPCLTRTSSGQLPMWWLGAFGDPYPFWRYWQATNEPVAASSVIADLGDALGHHRYGWAAAIALDGGSRSGVELGDQGTGVNGAEPSSSGELPSADRRAGGAEFGIDTLTLGALGQRLGSGLLRIGAARRRASAVWRAPPVARFRPQG